MLNAVLQKQKVTYAKYVAGKQQEIKPLFEIINYQEQCSKKSLQRNESLKEVEKEYRWLEKERKRKA